MPSTTATAISRIQHAQSMNSRGGPNDNSAYPSKEAVLNFDLTTNELLSSDSLIDRSGKRKPVIEVKLQINEDYFNVVVWNNSPTNKIVHSLNIKPNLTQQDSRDINSDGPADIFGKSDDSVVNGLNLLLKNYGKPPFSEAKNKTRNPEVKYIDEGLEEVDDSKKEILEIDGYKIFIFNRRIQGQNKIVLLIRRTDDTRAFCFQFSLEKNIMLDGDNKTHYLVIESESTTGVNDDPDMKGYVFDVNSYHASNLEFLTSHKGPVGKKKITYDKIPLSVLRLFQIDNFDHVITTLKHLSIDANIVNNHLVITNSISKISEESLAKMVRETGPIKKDFIESNMRTIKDGGNGSLLAPYIVSGEITQEALHVLYNAVTPPLYDRQREPDEKSAAFKTFLTTNIGIDSSENLRLPPSETGNPKEASTITYTIDKYITKLFRGKRKPAPRPPPRPWPPRLPTPPDPKDVLKNILENNTASIIQFENAQFQLSKEELNDLSKCSIINNIDSTTKINIEKGKYSVSVKSNDNPDMLSITIAGPGDVEFGGGGRLSRSQRRKRRRTTKAKRGGARKKSRTRLTRKNNKKSRSRSRSKSSKKRRVNARK